MLKISGIYNVRYVLLYCAIFIKTLVHIYLETFLHLVKCQVKARGEKYYQYFCFKKYPGVYE